MLRGSHWLFLACCLLALLGSTPPAGAEELKRGGLAPARPAYAHLFAIARSKNANIVTYEARLEADGFALQDPLRIRWKMLAADGRIERLTSLEEKAYGVRYLHVNRKEIRFSLAAAPSRELSIRQTPDGPKAIFRYRGEDCVLDEVYVSAGEGLIPRVRYVELRGRSLADGSARKERITP